MVEYLFSFFPFCRQNLCFLWKLFVLILLKMVETEIKIVFFSKSIILIKIVHKLCRVLFIKDSRTSIFQYSLYLVFHINSYHCYCCMYPLATALFCLNLKYLSLLWKTFSSFHSVLHKHRHMKPDKLKEFTANCKGIIMYRQCSVYLFCFCFYDN